VADDEPLPEAVERWEPTSALRSGPSGLEAIDTIVEGAARWLAPTGTLVVELAPAQRDAVLARAARAGFSATVEPDLTGRDRVLVARLD
jgi:release factor glutamine methyltransferase